MRGLLVQAVSLGAFAHRLLLDLHGVQRRLHVLQLLRALLAVGPALVGGEHLHVGACEDTLADLPRAVLDAPVALLVPAVEHLLRGQIAARQRGAASDWRVATRSHVDRRQKFVRVDAPLNVALILNPRQFGKRAVALRTLTPIQVLDVPRVLQIGARSVSRLIIMSCCAAGGQRSRPPPRCTYRMVAAAHNLVARVGINVVVVPDMVLRARSVHTVAAQVLLAVDEGHARDGVPLRVVLVLVAPLYQLLLGLLDAEGAHEALPI